MLNTKAKSVAQTQCLAFIQAHHSIRVRLLVSLGGTLIMTLAVVVVSLFVMATTIERTSWQERQVAATRLIEEQLRTFIAQAGRSMQFIVDNVQAILLAGRFSQLPNVHPALMELIVVDADGQSLAHDVRTATGAFDQDLQQTRWFQAVRRAEPNTVYIDKIAFTDQNIPFVVIALRGETGTTIATALSFTFANDILQNIHFGETGQAYIATLDGDIVAHTDARLVTARINLSGRPEQPNPDHAELTAAIFAADAPLTIDELQYTNFQGVLVSGTRAAMPGTAWVIFTEVADAEVFAGSRQLLLPLTIFASLFWGGAMLATSWVISNLIFAPLARLHAGQQAIAAGNLDTVVAVDRADEIGAVIAGFNAMAQELKQRITENQQAQATIDQTQHQMRQAADSLNGAIYQFCVDDAGWRLDYISDGIEKLSGLSAAAVMHDANLVLKVLHLEDKKAFIKALTDVFQTMSSNWVFEGRLVHAHTADVRWFRAEAKLQKVDTSGVVFKGVVLDISERKRFEDALRLNSKAVEASPVGIVIADAQQPDMPLVYANPMFEVMTGYSAAEVIGRNCRFLQGTDHQQPAIQTLRDTIHNGGETTVIVRNYRKNGTLFWNELTITPIFDAQGTITHYLGIQNDITQRRQSEDKLHALYRAITQSDLDLDEKLAQVLSMGAQVFGFELGIISHIEDDTFTILYAYSHDDRLQPGQVIDFKQTYCEITYRANDLIAIADVQNSQYHTHPCHLIFGLEAYIGISLHVHGQRFGTLNFASATPRQTAFSTADREFFTLMAQWVSTKLEQKLTEDALRKSEANLRSILDNTPAMIARISPQLEIEFFRIHGAAPNLLDVLVGRSFLNFVPQEYHALVTHVCQRVLAEGSTQQYQTKYLDPRDGKDHWYTTHVAPIYEENGIVSLLLIGTDITDRIIIEQRIEEQNLSLIKTNQALAVARQQAEESSRLKSQFLATMSHELRTPLNAIIGYTQLQLAGMVGELNAEQYEFQERVLANSQHLLHLINEVLDLSKIESGRIELMNALFNLRHCLQEIVTQNNVLAAKKGLTLSLAIADDLPEMITGDRGRIKQIIINLVSNAIKFTDAGGVSIRAALHNDRTILVQVTDTGVGIAAHLHEVIFEEFRQLEGQERGGTGLGLPIARRLARMMGGDITVSSDVGLGSQFTVYLPFKPLPTATK